MLWWNEQEILLAKAKKVFVNNLYWVRAGRNWKLKKPLYDWNLQSVENSVKWSWWTGKRIEPVVTLSWTIKDFCFYFRNAWKPSVGLLHRIEIVRTCVSIKVFHFIAHPHHTIHSAMIFFIPTLKAATKIYGMGHDNFKISHYYESGIR